MPGMFPRARSIHAYALAIDVTHRQRQPLAQAQAHAVQREEEHPVAEHPRRADQSPHQCHADDVWQAADLGRANEIGHRPGFAQHMLGKELQPVQIELDPAPRMRGHQIGEILDRLVLAECVDLVHEILANAAHAARLRIKCVNLHPTRQPSGLGLLRVAASSNPSLEPFARGAPPRPGTLAARRSLASCSSRQKRQSATGRLSSNVRADIGPMRLTLHLHHCTIREDI